MSVAGRLLVIDFDYFFRNPTMAAGPVDEAWMRCDWSSRESPFHIGDVWYLRSAAFLREGLALPRCEGDYWEYERFWDRFAFTEAALWRYGAACDSNMHAGRLLPSSVGLQADGWAEVHLYDAHHDCGYDGRDDAGWEATGVYGCADWMRLHHGAGSRLNVHYPRWRADESGELVDCEEPPAVPVDRRVDDGQPVAEPFDAVLVCRSGAWVPSWCDDQFEEFLEAAPVEMLWIEDRVQRDRAFDVDLARRQAEAALAALAGPQPPGA